MMAAEWGKGRKQSQRVAYEGGKSDGRDKGIYSSHEHHTTGENQQFRVAYSSKGRSHYMVLSGKSKLPTIHTA